MGTAEDIERLQRLRESGALTEEEFAAMKAKILNQPSVSPNDWAMALHLSQLAGLLMPILGLVAPIVIWQWKKAEIPMLDEHGKNVTNWIISELIYGAVAALLAFLFIGFPLLIGLFVLGLVFPIIGGLKAQKGEVWRYPLSLRLIS